MKSIILVLKKVQNLLPYFILIVIYFFFISLEVGNEKKSNRVIEKKYEIPKNENVDDDKQLKKIIPVIPYIKENSN